MILTGREIKLPTDLMFFKPTARDENEPSPLDYVNELKQARLRKVYKK